MPTEAPVKVPAFEDITRRALGNTSPPADGWYAGDPPADVFERPAPSWVRPSPTGFPPTSSRTGPLTSAAGFPPSPLIDPDPNATEHAALRAVIEGVVGALKQADEKFERRVTALESAPASPLDWKADFYLRLTSRKLWVFIAGLASIVVTAWQASPDGRFSLGAIAVVVVGYLAAQSKEDAAKAKAGK